jgi:Uncharacterized protein with a bacterial SH3 domain homologue
MRRPLLALAALLFGLTLPMAAGAATSGYATGNVNMRAGPGTAYPVIVTMRAGDGVVIHGCLSNRSWCDTSWRGYRGWVSSSYLAGAYSGRRVPVQTYAPTLGVPVISFYFDRYWNNHYRSRSFYHRDDYWRRWGHGHRPPPRVEHRPPRQDWRPPRGDHRPPRVEPRPPRGDHRPPRVDHRPPRYEDHRPPRADQRPPRRDERPDRRDRRGDGRQRGDGSTPGERFECRFGPGNCR